MSEYKELFEKRYKKENPTYAENADYLFMLNAPYGYRFEDEMLQYLKDNPNASMEDLYKYFDDNVPEGLPFNITQEELMSDD